MLVIKRPSGDSRASSLKQTSKYLRKSAPKHFWWRPELILLSLLQSASGGLYYRDFRKREPCVVCGNE
jgi:hypothetical protein